MVLSAATKGIVFSILSNPQLLYFGVRKMWHPFLVVLNAIAVVEAAQFSNVTSPPVYPSRKFFPDFPSQFDGRCYLYRLKAVLQLICFG